MVYSLFRTEWRKLEHRPRNLGLRSRSHRRQHRVGLARGALPGSLPGAGQAVRPQARAQRLVSDRPQYSRLPALLDLVRSPGSGKGTQATLLRDKLGMAHISTGDMLRARVASGDELGTAVAGIMQSGGLVPDEMVNRMVEDRIELPDRLKSSFWMGIRERWPRRAARLCPAGV